jgi:hypothetical protein
MGKKLSNREASEMQANVEGVIALLAQWDRTAKRKSHDAPKD